MTVGDSGCTVGSGRVAITARQAEGSVTSGVWILEPADHMTLQAHSRGESFTAGGTGADRRSFPFRMPYPSHSVAGCQIPTEFSI